MADHDLSLHVPIPHEYLTSFSVQQAIDADVAERAKALREFRGYVVARGFDIENLLSEIITHLLFLNRSPYKDETRDEYMWFIHCRTFIRKGMLEEGGFGFGRKISFAKKIIAWLPMNVRDSIGLPERELAEAVRWRNAFAHDVIEFIIDQNNSLIPMLKMSKTSYNLCNQNLKAVANAMESGYEACQELERRLSCRFGDAGHNPMDGPDWLSKPQPGPAQDH
jgi:hypothetical protein